MKIDSVYFKIDSLEQNSKRSNLRFFGLRETTDEICKTVVLDILTNKMKLNSIRVDDIEAAYRVGTGKRNTPRAVLKKVLKGSKITIREDLTKARMDLVKEKMAIYGKQNVWTLGGKVKWIDGSVVKTGTPGASSAGLHDTSINDIAEKLEYLNNAILSVLDIHAPHKQFRFTKPQAPWLTDNLIMIMDVRDAAKNKYSVLKSHDYYKSYKEARNYATQAVKNAKKAFFNRLSKNRNSKEMWKSAQ
nr:unnamed protein product [Callosobruchus analis]